MNKFILVGEPTKAIRFQLNDGLSDDNIKIIVNAIAINETKFVFSSYVCILVYYKF